jgi:hypothetical protein
MFKNNRAQYILDGTVCRGLGGPVYCGKEFNFPADLPAQFARILHSFVPVSKDFPFQTIQILSMFLKI